MAGEAAALGLSLLVLPVAARRFDSVGFSEYVVAFRLLAVVQPTLMLGTGVALTRALAGTPSDRRRMETPGLVAGAALPVAAMVLLVVAAVALFPQQLSEFVFDRRGADETLFAAVVLIAGSCTYTVASSALRGVFAMSAANLMYPVYLGVIPLAAIAVFGESADALAAIGFAWVVLAMAFGVRLIAGPLSSAARRARELLSYGIPRIPGEFALFGLLSIPSIAAVRTDGVVAGGNVGLAMSLVTLGGSACAPFASALLPHASSAMNDPDELSALAALVRTFTFRLVVGLTLVSVAIAIAAPVALRVGLGPEYERAATSLRIGCIAVPAYGLYVSLRSVLDAAFHRPITMRYAVYCLVLFLVSLVVLAGRMDNAVMVAFCIAVWCLALLVLRRTMVFLEHDA